MSLTLYMDVHVRRAVTAGLRLHGVDVLTAQEDDAAQLPDDDRDLLEEATRRQRAQIHFAGVIYAHQIRVTVGQCIDDLELLAKAAEPADLVDQVEHLPLR